MKKATVMNVFLATLFLFVAGCATMETAGHKYIMKGQVLDVSGGEAYLCIGSADGASSGQEFPVYRYVKLPFAGPKQTTPSFTREMVGTVKIKQVVDVHYATATILNGDIKTNDVAELGR
ncbi:MAG: hypothetical protein AB9919_07735 [Geobacteraceae bacterium]